MQYIYENLTYAPQPKQHIQGVLYVLFFIPLALKEKE